MSDVKKGLPVRTEEDADLKLQVKLCDGATPAQMATVDTDLNLHVEVHGNQPGGSDVALRLSQLGAPNGDGVYDATNNTKPSQAGVIAHARDATLDDTKQTRRVTAVAGASNSMCLDIALHDESGQPYSASNPIPVSLEDSEGTEVHDFLDTSTAANGGTSDHDYVVASGQTLKLYKVLCSASSRAKYELKIGNGALSEVFVTKAVKLHSEDVQSVDIDLEKAITVVGTANGTTVRVIRTNRDNGQAQSIYTTIVGVLV
jgi:hypothetical protein